jgi:CheY-like chemotaxis protein
MAETRKTILIVDDQELLVSGIKQMFRDKPYDFVYASSPAAALQAWESHGGKIDLVITDYNMKTDKTGIDLIQDVRKRGISVPCILMSDSDEGMLTRQLKAVQGNNSFVPKGDLFELLPIVVEEKLGQSSRAVGA